jgi:hypothetical protein
MTKPLLALSLMLMQLLPVGAAPLYLCLDGDGSVCIDFGPASCGCCHDEHHKSATETNVAIGGHAGAEHAPCDCAHIQISKSPGPVILSPTINLGRHFVGAIFSSPVSVTSRLLLPATQWDLWLTASNPPRFFTPLAALWSVALRC